MIHEIKIQEEYFDKVLKGIKSFEVRKNDRDYLAGQEVVLREYNVKTKLYTGRILHREITYVYRNEIGGLENGYCVFGLKKI
jgi:hypothetical protein